MGLFYHHKSEVSIILVINGANEIFADFREKAAERREYSEKTRILCRIPGALLTEARSVS